MSRIDEIAAKYATAFQKLLDDKVIPPDVVIMGACKAAIQEFAAGEPVALEKPFYVVELFKNGNGAGYWDGGHSRSFDKDINKAIQFRRRADAFWATRGWHLKDTLITEHIYIDAATRAEPTYEPCFECHLGNGIHEEWCSHHVVEQIRVLELKCKRRKP